MKARSTLLLPLVVAAFSACQPYAYRVLAPAGFSESIVALQTITVPYDPLQYSLVRQHGSLNLQITNPADDRIMLLGEQSYLIDPHGRIHPLRGNMLEPHSTISLLLPPKPASVEGAYGSPPGQGWSWRKPPSADPSAPDFYAPPASYAPLTSS